ncbi:MAG: hypothetical protein CMM53_01365 [Rhodospirillaceae bacterium]|nr:hypothetical protein [Rhodospirillaceae bacterium]|tara:strand:+ start:310 stop:1809 length:1500 start_codon:yes stop_codon:yes gene_type:complete
MGTFIGIDLGTTFSAVAQVDETGRPVIIRDTDGNNITPSCVTEREDGVMEVGEYARRTWSNAPDRAAGRFKRDMGTSVTHKIGSNEYTPTELSGFVLKKMKAVAESVTGEVDDAVVTIPANFSNEAREATLAAAKASGLKVNFIINEPTAAALFYAFKNGEELNGNYAVYDLGGGTFDISIICINGQDVDVLSSNGVAKLGGDDFDKALIKLVASKYKEENGEDYDPEDFPINDAEEEKKSLSRRKRSTAKVGRKFVEISREEFEESISSLVTQAELLCESTLEEAGIKAEEIKGIFLAGGSTRIPLVQESIKRTFKQDPISSENVDEVVALGAALYAAYKSDGSSLTAVQKSAVEKIKVVEATGQNFGTLAMQPNPQGGEDILRNTIIIKKNEKIPCSITESFYTIFENQTGVDCKVTECSSPEEDPRFVTTIFEGELELPSGRAKGEEIKVTYSYDENQTLKCSFEDVGTGKKTEVDLDMASDGSRDASGIDKFLVE